MTAALAAERAARDSYGRLLAILASRSRDIALSEDALADAFATALERWPEDGVPAQPEAWLLTVARRHTLDAWRRTRVQEASVQTLLILADDLDRDDGRVIPDERLSLMFVCAHPAVAAAARSPLMLQTVLGLDVGRMAGAFLTAPSALSQRLVRAKARIRSAGIPFEQPRSHDLGPRLNDVLEGIYAAYGTGWEDVEGADSERRGLTSEAIALGYILCKLLPREPEPAGLLALMLFCEARAAARRSAGGHYVPLDQQDLAQWDRAMIGEAEKTLMGAAGMGRLGPYQLEAAIQSAHTQGRLGRAVPPSALVALYDGLLAFNPSLGAQVSRACAVALASGASHGLKDLESVYDQEPRLMADYQPYWAARAHLLAQLNRRDDAQQAYARAIGLTTAAAVKNYLALASSRL